MNADRETQGKGYPWWQWVLAVLTLWPWTIMLVAMFEPKVQAMLTPRRNLVLILVSLVSLMAIGAFCDPDDKNSTLPADAPESPKPTATLALTSTAEPTTEPTAVAKCSSPEDQEYLGDARKFLSGISNEMQFVGELSIKAGQNPGLLFSEDWKFQMETHLYILSNYSRLIRTELSPAGHLRSHYDVLVSIAGKVDEFVTLITEGYEDIDDAKFLVAAGLLNDLSVEMMHAGTQQRIICS